MTEMCRYIPEAVQPSSSLPTLWVCLLDGVLRSLDIAQAAMQRGGPDRQSERAAPAKASAISIVIPRSARLARTTTTEPSSMKHIAHAANPT
jgi:hypothetical protein